MSNPDPTNVTALPTVNIRGAGLVNFGTIAFNTFAGNFNIDGSSLRVLNNADVLGMHTNQLQFSANGGSLDMRNGTAGVNYNYPVVLNGNATFNQSNTSNGFAGQTNSFGALTVLQNATLNSTNTNGATNEVNSGNVGLTFPSASLGANLIVNVLNPTVGGGVGSVAIGTTGGAGISETVAGRTLTKTGPGNLSLLGSATYTGVTNVQAGSLTMVDTPAWSQVLSGGGANLTGGRLVFDYSTNVGNNPKTQIMGILNAAGYANHFATGQIRTSAAPDNLHTIGWIDDTAKKQVRAAYTFAGDANVDGTVNTADFTLLAQNFNTQTGAVWAQGDFDYNGKVDSNDFNAIATNFGAVIPGAAVEGGTVDGGAVALGALVPEPSTFAMMAIGAACLARRRRK
jgi:autotransporter-associated beta strand protein